MNIDISQFYQVFFEESSEHLAEMEHLLLEMDVDSPDIEEMNAIFRAAHSIKGGSGTFGFTDMTEVTHVLENLLDRLRRGEMAPRTEMVDIFLEAADVLREQLNCHINGTDADPAPAEAVCAKLRALADGGPSSEIHVAAANSHIGANGEAEAIVKSPLLSAFRTLTITFRPGKTLPRHASVIDELTSELARLGTLEIVALPAPAAPGKKAQAQTAGAEWRFRLTTQSSVQAIEDIFAFIAEPEEVVTLQESMLGCQIHRHRRAKIPAMASSKWRRWPTSTQRKTTVTAFLRNRHRRMRVKKRMTTGSASSRLSSRPKQDASEPSAQAATFIAVEPVKPKVKTAPDGTGSDTLDPCQRREGRSADQSGRRTGHHPGHAGADRVRRGPGRSTRHCTTASHSWSATPATCRNR